MISLILNELLISVIGIVDINNSNYWITDITNYNCWYQQL